MNSLKHGGYYKIDLAGRKLQLIALNMALYLDWNMGTRNTYHHDPAGQWHWLSASLEKVGSVWCQWSPRGSQAEAEHKSVILFGHTPPGVWEGEWRGPGRHWLQHHANIRYLSPGQYGN